LDQLIATRASGDASAMSNEKCRMLNECQNPNAKKLRGFWAFLIGHSFGILSFDI
jgi:hypothetical protein